jgi:hypothetical protein
MNKKIYRITVLALVLFSSQILANNALTGLSTDESSNSISDALTTPDIDVTVETTDVYVWFNIQTEGNNIEVYRSLSATTGFQRIATVPDSRGYYLDANLKSRTTFYYKARAVNGSQTSAFSDVESITTYAKYFRPSVTATARDPYTIEITFTDNSYYDQSYEIFAPGAPGEFDYQHAFQMLDSGRTVTLVHYPVTPGTTYSYDVLTMPQQYDAGAVEEHNIATATTPRDEYCGDTGEIERELWSNVSGYGTNLIPVTSTPRAVTTLTSFSTPVNEGDNYGARVRGFVCAPQSGNYTFWITSDDNSELWLSTDERMENKRLIASSKWTSNNTQWDKYPTQQSILIPLQAGKKYYIEALHKENAGRDFLAVGWRLPNGTLERPIPGVRLSKFPRQNIPATVSVTSPADNEEFTAPADIRITADASDPDGDDILYVEFSTDTGVLGRDYEPPYEFQWNDVQPGHRIIRASVLNTYQNTYSYDDVGVTVKAPVVCSATGKITREIWNYISGTDPSVIPLNAPPHRVETYTSFETAQKTGDNYGSRMRGYVCVPVTGNYTFWISSDDRSVLYLSTDDSPANKIQIASVAGYTGFRVYDKYTTQKSAPVNLVAGRRYYIEAIHKEATGNDFISVGWQLPNGTLERPIPGNRLIDVGTIATNKNPTVQITSPADGTNYPTAPANVKVTATASDPDGTIKNVAFYLNDRLYNTDTQAPYEYTFQNLPAGSHQIHALATDNSNTVSLWSRIVVSVGDTNASCSGAGKIYWEVWGNTPGSTVADIPIGQREPNQIIELSSFETPSYYGNDYGSRIRGYICPPRTGAYIFSIASDDASELWLSTNDNPANKRKIAYLLTATQPRNWFTARPEQHSAQITLTAGTKYYIEALHKEAAGNDHVSVAWRFVVDGTFEGPIPGNRLIPFSTQSSSSAMMVSSSDTGKDEMLMSVEESDEVYVYPNPTSSRQITVSLGNLQAVSNPRVEIISTSGKIVQAANVDCDGCASIDLTLDNNVTSGLYLVNVVMNQRRVTKKLQVK